MGRAVSIRHLLYELFFTTEFANPLRLHAFQCTHEFFDPTIARIAYQMNMIRHNNISDQFAWPVAADFSQHLKKFRTIINPREDRQSVDGSASDKMQRARQV